MEGTLFLSYCEYEPGKSTRLNNEIAQLKTSLYKSRAETDKWKVEKATVQSTLDHEKQIAQQRKTKTDDEIKQIKSSLKHNQEALNDWRKKQTETTSAWETARSQLNHSKEEIALMKSEMKLSRTQTDTLSKSFEKERKSLKDAHEGAVQENGQLLLKIAQQQAYIVTLMSAEERDSKSAFQNDLSMRQEELKQVTSLKGENRSLAHKLKQSLKQQETLRMEFEDTESALEKEINQLLEQNRLLNRDIKSLNRKIGFNVKDMEILRKELSEAEAALDLEKKRNQEVRWSRPGNRPVT